MTREELIKGLKKRLVDSTIEEYIEGFDAATSNGKQNSNAVEFYAKLQETDKRVFLEIIRQVEIDTVADFLAFLDGIYWIDGQTDDMLLVCLENPDEKLNEDLTDLFLSSIHHWKR